MKEFDKKANPIVTTQPSMRITINNTSPAEEIKAPNQKPAKLNSSLGDNQEASKSIPTSSKEQYKSIFPTISW